MTTAGWVFLVGFRVFDLGALVAWLVWFYRLRDAPDEGGGDDGPGGGSSPDPGPDPAGPEPGLPLPDAEPWPARRRGHEGRPAHGRPPRRGAPERPARPGRIPSR
jgi:hypothetical protein